MPRKKPSQEDLEAREELSAQLIRFSKDHLFTEISLAEVLGVSRRTIQMIKAAKVTPHPGTKRKWLALVQKYKNEGWKDQPKSK